MRVEIGFVAQGQQLSLGSGQCVQLYCLDDGPGVDLRLCKREGSLLRENATVLIELYAVIREVATNPCEGQVRCVLPLLENPAPNRYVEAVIRL